MREHAPQHRFILLVSAVLRQEDAREHLAFDHQIAVGIERVFAACLGDLADAHALVLRELGRAAPHEDQVVIAELEHPSRHVEFAPDALARFRILQIIDQVGQRPRGENDRDGRDADRVGVGVEADVHAALDGGLDLAQHRVGRFGPGFLADEDEVRNLQRLAGLLADPDEILDRANVVRLAADLLVRGRNPAIGLQV